MCRWRTKSQNITWLLCLKKDISLWADWTQVWERCYFHGNFCREGKRWSWRIHSQWREILDRKCHICWLRHRMGKEQRRRWQNLGVFGWKRPTGILCLKNWRQILIEDGSKCPSEVWECFHSNSQQTHKGSRLWEKCRSSAPLKQTWCSFSNICISSRCLWNMFKVLFGTITVWSTYSKLPTDLGAIEPNARQYWIVYNVMLSHV